MKILEKIEKGIEAYHSEIKNIQTDELIEHCLDDFNESDYCVGVFKERFTNTENYEFLKAVNILKNAQCEEDVLSAIHIKEELVWLHLSEYLKDLWNEYYGDAKKYLS